MNGGTFIVALQRRCGAAAVADPLGFAQDFLAGSGDSEQGALFRRLLRTLATGDGEYLDAELDLFGHNLALLASSVIEARIAGVYPQAVWDAFR